MTRDLALFLSSTVFTFYTASFVPKLAHAYLEDLTDVSTNYRIAGLVITGIVILALGRSK